MRLSAYARCIGKLCGIAVIIIVTLHIAYINSILYRNEGPRFINESDCAASRSRHRLLDKVELQETTFSRNVISMSLYGDKPRYTVGAIRNAQIIHDFYPGWMLRVYMEKGSDNTTYGPVPQPIKRQLTELGVEIRYIDVDRVNVPPRMWRFLVADDENVTRFLVRDTDSRFTDREVASVQAWIESGVGFHCMRDHPNHSNYAINAGMFGAIQGKLKEVMSTSWAQLMQGLGSNYIDDTIFLNTVIWPKVKHIIYCSDSVSCRKYPNSFPFPQPRCHYEIVGAVYNEHDKPRSRGVKVLQTVGENPDCLPNTEIARPTFDKA